MSRWPWVLDQGSIWPLLGVGLTVDPRGEYLSLPLQPWYGTEYVFERAGMVRGWWCWCLLLRLQIGKPCRGVYKFEFDVSIVLREL